MDIFQRRREKLKSLIGDGVLILPAAHEKHRNNDVFYPFRQDSHFFYFTGFEDPDAIFIFRPERKPETIMFIRPKDTQKEMWDGFSYGPEDICKSFSIDKAYNLLQMDSKLPDFLEGASRIYYRLGGYSFDSILKDTLLKLDKKQGRSGRGFPPIFDPCEILGEQRVIKTGEEIFHLRKACELSADAHINAMRFIKPDVSERQVEAVLEYTIKKAESPRWGYYPIVASGNNACTLHYKSNDQICRDGDLLLIDAGAEWNYYTADITRTFPVNGRFTDVQRDFYQDILNVQKDIIKKTKHGVTFELLQNETIKGLSQILLNWNILEGSLDEVISKKLYKKYYPHSVGHFLGMDVHDVGLYKKDDQPRSLEHGVCLTIEPGLYIMKDDDSAPKGLRGLGIRIEDDILICENGCEVLSKRAPKEVKEIEETMSKAIS